MKTLPRTRNFHPYKRVIKRLASLYGMLPEVMKMLKQKRGEDEIFQQLRAIEALVYNAIYEHFEGHARGRIHQRIKTLQAHDALPDEVLLLIGEIKYKHAAAPFKKLGKAFYYLSIAETKTGLRSSINVNKPKPRT